jgi:AhpD family alkylhydroperoxidase
MVNAVMDEKVDAYKVGLGQFNDALPNVVEAYHSFTAECFADRALSAKQKQLIALGIAMYANNEICTYYHVTEALSNGASAEEIMDAVAVAAAVGGGHAMSQGVTRVQQALSGGTQRQ